MSSGIPAISTAIAPSLLRGFVELDPTEKGLLPHRLPAWARAQCSDPQLTIVEEQPSGVRFKFKTAAKIIELDVIVTRRELVGMPPRRHGIFDMYVDGRLARQQSARGANVIRIDMATGSTVHVPGQIETLRFADLDQVDKLVELWLPYDERTELLALRSDAPISPVTETGTVLWLHHGSSISQGSNAASPTGIWPAVAARQSALSLTNLSLSGNALLDPFTARTIRDTPADFISIKIGINLANLDLMRMRAFEPAVEGFLDTIRDGHQDKPLLVISPIFCPIHEETPGPGMFDTEALAKGEVKFLASGKSEEVGGGKLTLISIREKLEAIVGRRSKVDKQIYYMDGQRLYGREDYARLPLPDRLHPCAGAHDLIGRRFSDEVRRMAILARLQPGN